MSGSDKQVVLLKVRNQMHKDKDLVNTSMNNNVQTKVMVWNK